MSSGPKIRLDQVLVDRGMVPTRSRAQDLIKNGYVSVDGTVVLKAGHKTNSEAKIDLQGDGYQWVSRGALKLLKALETFPVEVSGRVAVDVGASTGGFTEVLLEHGARRVYAVDVGHGQLARKLCEDERVVNCEGVNARYLSKDDLSEKFDLIVCDASFISLKLVLDSVTDMAPAGTQLVALVKPQFEVGKGRVGKGGIVRDPDMHQEVCESVQSWLEGKVGWQVKGLVESPITGPDGNIEFLLYAVKSDDSAGPVVQ